MYSEDNLLLISGLQHLQFCERQWGLIHIEQQWEDNRLTAEGRILHERVHDTAAETRPGIIIARGLRIRSFRLGLAGQADVVEFHRVNDESTATARLPGREGWWMLFPIEYKRGRPKRDSCDEVQLCAQAICLEEMFNVALSSGSLFYGKIRRRIEVSFDRELRARTQELAARMHELYSAGITPSAVYAKKCEGCSLYNRCLPRAMSKGDKVQKYLASALRFEEL